MHKKPKVSPIKNKSVNDYSNNQSPQKFNLPIKSPIKPSMKSPIKSTSKY